MLVSGSPSIDVGSGLATLSGPIADVGTFEPAGGLTKTGAGTLRLSGLDTYTGATTVAAGTLTAGGDYVFSRASAYTVDAGAVLDLNHYVEWIGSLAGAGSVITGDNLLTGLDNTSTTFSGIISGTGSLTKMGSGTFTLSGANSYSGKTVVTEGTLAVTGDGTIGTGTLSLLGGSTLDLTGSGGLANAMLTAGQTKININTGLATLSGPIADGYVFEPVGGLTKLGAGTLRLSGLDTYTGATTVAAGTLTAGGDYVFSGRSAFSVAAGAVLDLNGFAEQIGSLSGAGQVIASGDLTTGSDNTSTTFSGVISGDGGLTKAGSGTFTVTGASTYTGLTEVADGTLQVDGAIGPVIVDSGAALGGKGSIGGPVEIDDGGHLLGTQGQTLHTGSLGLSEDAQVDVGLSAPGGGALFDVAGDLTLDGVLNVESIGGVGVYRLFDYSGSLADNGMTIGAAPVSGLLVQTAVADEVNLVNAGGETLTFWDGGLPANHDNDRVDGGDGAWTLADDNWTDVNGAVNSAYEPSFAIFQAAPGVVTVDDSGGAVAVTGMQFTVDGYRIDGDPLTLSGPQSVIRVGDGSSDGADVTATIAVDLTGAATLVKDDLGTLVLSGTDTYTGGTVIAGGTLQIGDGGTTGSVVGDIADDAALTFDRSDSFTYAGVISGTGALTKQGAGTLTLSGDSPFTGITTISGGTLKIGDGGTTGSLAGDIVDDAALIFERSDALTYAGVISGTGELSKQGAGTLTLSGDSPLSGPTTVGAGTLVVDGSLAHSPFTIQSGATLAGGGTVGDLTVDAGGTVAPGLVTPITTLSVAGDVSFASGSTLAVTVLPDGRSDRLAATGTITLGGSTLAVTAGAGKFNPTTHATILTAGGGVTGSFGNVTSNLAFLTPSLAYGAGGITLGFTQTAELASAGNNRNQRAVADALQALGSASPLYDAVIGQDAGGARQAFNALSGEAHASAITAGLSDQRLIRDAILDRLSRPAAAPAAGQTMALAGRHGFGAAAEAPDDTLGFWSQAIGDTGTNRGDAEVAALSHQTAGVIFGGDVGGLDVPGGTARLGAAGGYLHDNFDVDERASSGRVDSVFAALYGSAAYGPVQLSAGAAYSRNTTRLDRRIVFPGFGEAAASEGHGTTAQAFGEAGYRFDLAAPALGGLPLGHAWLQPFAGGAVVHLHQDGFGEDGGLAALSALAASQDVATTTLGLRAEAALTGALPLTARTMLGWRHAYGDAAPTAALAFQGGSPFTVEGAAGSRDAFVAEASLDYALTTNAAIGVAYAGQFGRTATDNTFSAFLKVQF